MIKPLSYLNVADNCGARELMCIRGLSGSYRESANIGDVIIAVVIYMHNILLIPC